MNPQTYSVGTVLAWVVLAVAIPLGDTVQAELDSRERRCISTFTKSLRKVSKTHGKLIKKCVSDFAKGRLANQTPEQCVIEDPRGRLASTILKETTKVSIRCVAGFPSFGARDPSVSFGHSVISQIDLVHRALGEDLDLGLIATPQADATCQARVHAAVLKCADARLKEYARCQAKNIKTGAIVDAETMSQVCLGSGLEPQPDPTNRIGLKCLANVTSTIARHCLTTDLTQAFPPCGESDPIQLGQCLSHQSACEMCLVLNEVGGIVRDCDAFDDGDDSNGSCQAECTDGLIHPDESCDDGNGVPGDGCSDFCLEEAGWTCTGEPSVCTPNCGNGALDEDEACDDAGTASDDGCDEVCQVEDGWTCTGEPSLCSLDCSNGSVDTGEACDDGNPASGDGCSDDCTVEPGYECTGEPSTCTFVCGNGSFDSGETCDDNNAIGGDGCSGFCQIEPGWSCSESPSACAPICGDGRVDGTETCDDGNLGSGDGCSFFCQIELGYACQGQRSSCSPVCGDGFVRHPETCDDSNSTSGDGCSATICRQEFDHFCAGQPSVCVALCGDGNLDGAEECDDGNLGNGDGCAGNCTTEPGFSCFGTPSLCVPNCGNATINADEECDDGNSVPRDGCSPSCQVDPGWVCGSPGTACDEFVIAIQSPSHGVFSTAGSVVVNGQYSVLTGAQSSVRINGEAPTTLDPVARTFSHTVTLDESAVFNPILATLTNTENGDEVRDRVVVIAGDSIADGNLSPQSVTLRINDSGLASLEPLVGELAAGQFDLSSLVPPGTVVTDQCFLDVIGCWGGARVTIANPPPSFNALGLAIDSKTNAVNADVGINGLVIDVNIDGWGLVPDCRLRMTASSMHLIGDYALEPAANPAQLDVNLVGSTEVSFNGFSSRFTSGLCTAPIIGDIIQAALPNVQDLAVGGIAGFVGDPDGAGPADSPIAQGIEDVLAGISVSGPVGDGLGLDLYAPLFAVTEDADGVTLGADSAFTVEVGTGPGECVPPVGAPNLVASYTKDESVPSFGPNTPGGTAYGMGICISTGGFNQLLRGQTECGLMRSSISDIDLDGAGPIPALTVDSTLLSALIPQFGQLPPATPLRIDVAPTLAPVVTGTNGPAGEVAELKMAHMTLQIIEPGPDVVWLEGALDLVLGMDLAFLPDGSGLDITIGEPEVADVSLTILDNPLGVDLAQVESVLPSVITPLIPDLAGALSGFPLPQFFGLSIEGVEVSRNGEFMSLFANLGAAP